MKCLLACLCLLSLISCNGSRYAYDDDYWGGYGDDGYYHQDHWDQNHPREWEGHEGHYGGGHGGGRH